MSRAQRQKSRARSHDRNIAERFRRAPLRLPEQSIGYLLDELCVELGYCLSIAAQDSQITSNRC